MLKNPSELQNKEISQIAEDNQKITFDNETMFEKIDDKTYILSGSMPIYDVNKLLESSIPEGDYDTLSGYLIELLGRIPEDDEKPVIETEKVTSQKTQLPSNLILVQTCDSPVSII